MNKSQRELTCASGFGSGIIKSLRIRPFYWSVLEPLPIQCLPLAHASKTKQKRWNVCSNGVSQSIKYDNKWIVINECGGRQSSGMQNAIDWIGAATANLHKCVPAEYLCINIQHQHKIEFIQRKTRIHFSHSFNYKSLFYLVSCRFAHDNVLCLRRRRRLAAQMNGKSCTITAPKIRS